MPRKLLATAALIALVVATLLLAGGPSSSTSADTGLDSEELAFITLINNWRAQNGAGPLTVTSTITNATEWMNNDMGTNHYFSHTDSLGRSPWDRMCYYGYCYNTWKGENIAAGFTTAQSVFDAWKASSGHNANMLNANFKVMGLSRLYVAGSDYGWYWTNDFGGYVPPNDPPPAPTATPAPAPTQAPPPGFGCASDWDCDGWSDAAESAIGTNSGSRCAITRTASDEPTDSVPADFNDDKYINGSDVISFNTKFASTNRRWDLNRDGIVNGQDVLTLNQYMFTHC
jgi:uncharacterized protein YkwD